MRVVQLSHVRGDRRVAVVEDGHLSVLTGPPTVFALATAALDARTSLRECVARHLSPERIDYDSAYGGLSEWRILPVVDHPDDPARLLVSGTGLTHRRSADQRQFMHAADAAPTDSVRMYELRQHVVNRNGLGAGVVPGRCRCSSDERVPLAVLNQAATPCQDSRRHENDQHADP